MIDDRLNYSLTNMGYHRIDSNAQGIYLFYQVQEDNLNVVSVIHADNGDEITVEQYGHILEQMKNNLKNSFPQKLQLLSLVLTRFPDRVKYLCSSSEEDSHWIIDINTNRLMIYETQTNDFAGLKNGIEALLEEEQRQNYGESSYDNGYEGIPDQNTKRNSLSSVQFTLASSILAGVNVIIFIIYRYTQAFGGEEQMFMKGALSWYFVREGKEYYRFLTSMFLHADWSHLINNMIVLIFIGTNLERITGKLKFLLIYFGTGIVAGITSFGYNMWKEQAEAAFENTTFSIGASGAIFGIVGALLFIVLINRGRLKEINPTQMILFVILSLYSGIANSRIDQAAHVGGFLGGLILALIVYRKPGTKNVANQV